MKIVVIGGTGLIGSKVVAGLEARGHEAVVATPSTGVDTVAGTGLAEALRGAQVVVDVSNSPVWEDEAVLRFFETSTRNVLTAADEAGVGHVVALSIVGAKGLPGAGYMRAKVAQEALIEGWSLPYTIIHATQFFEFAGTIVGNSTVGDEVRVAPIQMQPIASDDVAAAVIDAALAEPLNGATEIAGPERLSMREFVTTALLSIADPRTVVEDANAGYFGANADEYALVPGDADGFGGAHLAKTTFSEWRTRNTVRV